MPVSVYLAVVAPLFLFAFTIGVGFLNYKERIIHLKNCYIKLDDLYVDLELLQVELSSLENSEVKSRFDKIRDEYINILENVENHNL